ncbi:hypothetical protein AUK45_03925 [Candidatus Peregrinibacteria bacterium CG2_30_44_17]|nr:MAG: hypothetical protein AUK45_03925 [Candidatus Peregrinibacteria bacterium CG2_30_44_17]
MQESSPSTGPRNVVGARSEFGRQIIQTWKKLPKIRILEAGYVNSSQDVFSSFFNITLLKQKVLYFLTK